MATPYPPAPITPSSPRRYTSSGPYGFTAAAVALGAVSTVAHVTSKEGGFPLVFFVIGFLVISAFFADYALANASVLECDGTELWCRCGFRARVVDLADVTAFALERTGSSKQAWVRLSDGRRLRVSSTGDASRFLDFADAVHATAPWIDVFR